MGNSRNGIVLSGSTALNGATRFAKSNTTTEVVATNGTEVIDFSASANKIAELMGLYVGINAPVGAASGTHELKISLVSGTDTVPIAYFNVAYNVALVFTYSELSAGTVNPSDKAALLAALQKTRIDANLLLRFTYYNKTNVNTTSDRDYRLVFVERGVS